MAVEGRVLGAVGAANAAGASRRRRAGSDTPIVALRVGGRLRVGDAGRPATTARSSTERGATSTPHTTPRARPGAAGRAQQRNRALAIVLGTVALFTFMIVITLVVFLHDETARHLAHR